MANYTTIDDPSVYFQTILYSGNETARSITLDGNSDLQPDWVWIKQRNRADPHILYDSVRGTTKELSTNTKTVEHTNTDGLPSASSDGFSIGNHVDVNRNSTTFVAWNWKASNTTVTNASVGISNTQSVNDTAGISILTYQGNGSNTGTAHGLSVKPDLVIWKNRDQTDDWVVFHRAINTNGRQYIILNSTGAEQSSATIFQQIAPDNNAIYFGGNDLTNASGEDYIVYAFRSIKGFSKFGSYTGNGNAAGTFVYTGFKPAWIMYKNTESAANWEITDNKRAGFNFSNARLLANTSGAEDTGPRIDILSNGFKHRSSGNPESNKDGEVYVYLAFAESPLVTSTGVPTTAR